MDKLRNIFKNENVEQNEIRNDDGTAFIPISLSMLKEYNSLVTASNEVMKYYKNMKNKTERRMNTFYDLFE